MKRRARVRAEKAVKVGGAEVQVGGAEVQVSGAGKVVRVGGAEVQMGVAVSWADRLSRWVGLELEMAGV